MPALHHFAQNKWLLVLLLFGSIAALAFAYISQYVFGLKPCHLCMYQRYPYIFIAAISGAALLFARHEEALCKLVLGVALAALLAEIGIAFYHMGVEYKWFAGLTSCSGGETGAASREELLAQIMAAETVRCDEPAFIFMGLSMAGWNMLYATGFFLISAYMAFKGRLIKHKKG